jgi:HEPN domain-containing protein
MDKVTRKTTPNWHPPLWGTFVYYADYDLLSFAWLYQGGLRVPGYYHATQAVEKYLKALALSIIDPTGATETPRNKKWMHTHDLCELAKRCENPHPYYGQPNVKTQLQRFTEFDQLARYPWVKQNHGNGFNSADLPFYWDLVAHLRTDIPIELDDYPLGMGVRAFYHRRPSLPANEYLLADLNGSLEAVRSLFPAVNSLVRW